MFYELSYDSFHPNKGKILQVCNHDLKSGEEAVYTAIPLPLTLKRDFSEIKYVTGIWDMLGPDAEIKYNNLKYSGFTGASVEQDIFHIFNLSLIIAFPRAFI